MAIGNSLFRVRSRWLAYFGLADQNTASSIKLHILVLSNIIVIGQFKLCEPTISKPEPIINRLLLRLNSLNNYLLIVIEIYIMSNY